MRMVQRANACMQARIAAPSLCFMFVFFIFFLSFSTEHALLWRRVIKAALANDHVLYNNQCQSRYKEKIREYSKWVRFLFSAFKSKNKVGSFN